MTGPEPFVSRRQRPVLRLERAQRRLELGGARSAHVERGLQPRLRVGRLGACRRQPLLKRRLRSRRLLRRLLRPPRCARCGVLLCVPLLLALLRESGHRAELLRAAGERHLRGVRARALLGAPLLEARLGRDGRVELYAQPLGKAVEALPAGGRRLERGLAARMGRVDGAQVGRHRQEPRVDLLLRRRKERAELTTALDHLLERLLDLLVHVRHLADARLEVVLAGHGPRADDPGVAVQVAEHAAREADEVHRRRERCLVELAQRRRRRGGDGGEALLEAEAVGRRDVGATRRGILVALARPRALAAPRAGRRAALRRLRRVHTELDLHA
mmetsp:Transcript_41505/g.130437  ORF Transcript_41505/g.130437 Transcript_41505/m.130437 type:complete len:330 (-) Transcript_41505:2-991(-)